jgi:hypothetical protein
VTRSSPVIWRGAARPYQRGADFTYHFEARTLRDGSQQSVVNPEVDSKEEETSQEEVVEEMKESRPARGGRTTLREVEPES